MGDEYKKLKDRMDNASLDEVMPGFDHMQTWSELEQRIPKKKRMPLASWWSHAAALIAGLLIGGVLLNALRGKETVVQEVPVANSKVKSQNSKDGMPVLAEQQEIAPTVIKETDTLYIVKELLVGNSKVKYQKSKIQTPHHKSQITNSQFQSEPVIVQKPEPEKQEQPVIHDTPAQSQMVVVTQQKPARVKPIHLLDIENEDRQTALYHNDAEAGHRRGFVLQLSPKGLPDNKTNKAPTLLSPLLKH